MLKKYSYIFMMLLPLVANADSLIIYSGVGEGFLPAYSEKKAIADARLNLLKKLGIPIRLSSQEVMLNNNGQDIYKSETSSELPSVTMTLETEKIISQDTKEYKKNKFITHVTMSVKASEADAIKEQFMQTLKGIERTGKGVSKYNPQNPDLSKSKAYSNALLDASMKIGNVKAFTGGNSTFITKYATFSIVSTSCKESEGNYVCIVNVKSN